MSEIQRKKVIKEILENKGKSVSNAMRKAGYKKGYAKNPKLFLNTKKVKEELLPIKKRLEKERDEALAQMKRVRNKARYSELNSTVEGFTKLLQLLEGKPTEIQEIKELTNIIKQLADSSKENV